MESFRVMVVLMSTTKITADALHANLIENGCEFNEKTGFLEFEGGTLEVRDALRGARVWINGSVCHTVVKITPENTSFLLKAASKI